MHIAEGFLPPEQCLLWAAVATPFVVQGARAVIREVREHPERRMLLAASGAFTFVMSAIKLPSVSGSSSHPTGTGLGVILFRPPVMAFLSTIVLIFQALLLGHGGITTLGANVLSMGIAGPWAGYAMWVLANKLRAPRSVAIFLTFAIADLATYVVTSIELAIAYPDPASGFLGAALKFLSVFALTQIPLSIVEGIIGILLFAFIEKIAPQQLADLGVIPGDDLVAIDEEALVNA